MRNIFLIATMLFATVAFGQQDRELKYGPLRTGNVAINNSDLSPFGSFYPAIQGAGAASFVVGAKSNTLDLVANGYSGNDFQWKYASPGQKAATIRIDAPSGNIFFLNTDNASVAAGDNISWVDRMVLTSIGRLGLGVTNPLSKLAIGNNGVGLTGTQDLYTTIQDDGIRAGLGARTNSGFTRSVGVMFMHDLNNNRRHLYFGTDGILRSSNTETDIGTTTGNIIGQQSSDERLKSNIVDLPYGLNTVKKLKPIKYQMYGRTEIGFGAQTTLDIIPEAVYDTGEKLEGHASETRLAMEYVRIVPVLTKAIQELSAKLDRICAMHNVACEEN